MQQEPEGEGVRWLSYAELGELRGTSAASAKRFAIRKRWRKQPANDGTVRVAVPVTGTVSRIAKAAPVTGDQDGDRLTLSSVLAAIETAHLGEVEALRGQVEALKTLADSAAMRLVDAETRGTDLKAELERARADHREALERLQAVEAAGGILPAGPGAAGDVF
jgi:hypothetical protein